MFPPQRPLPNTTDRNSSSLDTNKPWGSTPEACANAPGYLPQHAKDAAVCARALCCRYKGRLDVGGEGAGDAPAASRGSVPSARARRPSRTRAREERNGTWNAIGAWPARPCSDRNQETGVRSRFRASQAPVIRSCRRHWAVSQAPMLGPAYLDGTDLACSL